MKQLALAFPFKRKEVKQMKKLFDWFDKLGPKEKANFLTTVMNLIIAVIKLVSQIIG